MSLLSLPALPLRHTISAYLRRAVTELLRCAPALMTLTLCCIALSCLLFAVYRVVFISSYSVSAVSADEYLRLFLRALRIDLHSAAQFFLPPLVIACVAVICTRQRLTDPPSSYIIVAISES